MSIWCVVERGGEEGSWYVCVVGERRGGGWARRERGGEHDASSCFPDNAAFDRSACVRVCVHVCVRVCVCVRVLRSV